MIREWIETWRAIWRMSDEEAWRYGLFLRHIEDELTAERQSLDALDKRLRAATRADRARIKRLEALLSELEGHRP